MAVTAALVVLFRDTLESWHVLLGAHVAGCGLLVGVQRLESPPRLLRVLRDWHPIVLFPLLYKEVGSDGLKTGHTKESGYGLTASAVRNGRRVVVVLSGLESVNQRSREAERLLDWGFREFGNYTLFEAANTVDTADVWLGTEAQVPLVLKDPLTVTLSRKARRAMTVKVAYDGPVPAPIAKGDRIGELIVDAPGAPGIGVPLFAGESVARLGVLGRFQAAVGYLLWGAAGR